MPGGIHPPLEIIATWPKPDYEHPELQHGAVGVTITFTIIALCMVTVRLFVRGVMQRNLGLDDWLITIAMVPTIGLSVGVCLACRVFYFNRHVWDVPYASLVDQRKITYANELCYLVSTTLIKISILCFYRRLSSATLSKTYLWIIYASIAFVAAYGIECVFLLIFNCNPVSDYWNQLEVTRIFSKDRPDCVNEPNSLMIETAISVLQDLIAAGVPTYLFWCLTIEPEKKRALIFVFFLGYLTCGVGVGRLVNIYWIFYKTYDVPHATYSLWILTALEPLLGAMAASLPPLKVFMRKISAPRRNSNFFSYDPWGRSHNNGAISTSASLPVEADEEATHDMPPGRQASWQALKEKFARRTRSDEPRSDTTVCSDYELKQTHVTSPCKAPRSSLSHETHLDKKESGGLWSHYVQEVPEEPGDGGTWYRHSVDD